MPEAIALPLCAYNLPAGHRCRQPRLRGEPHCRFHARSRAAAEHQARMDALLDQLEIMDLPTLLETLSARLENIQCALRCFPEARLTLLVALNRLNEEMSPQTGPSPAESMNKPQPQQNQ